jgi:hypothetical protein
MVAEIDLDELIKNLRVQRAFKKQRVRRQAAMKLDKISASKFSDYHLLKCLFPLLPPTNGRPCCQI